MRVLVYSQVPPPVHGSTLATMRLIDELRSAQVDVSILDRRFSNDVSSIGKPSPRKALAVISLLWRAHRSFSTHPDVLIFFTTNRTGSFLVDNCVAALARRKKLRIVHYIHTVGYESVSKRGRTWRRLVMKLFSHSAAVVTLSEKIASDIASFAGDARVEIIPNSVERLDPVSERSAVPTFVYLANLIREKGAPDVVAIAEKLEEAGTVARFEIYGYPADVETEREVRNASDRLESLTYQGPAVGKEAKSDLLGRAWYLLYPSRYRFEAQPLAIIEAMSCGTPCLAYDVGAVGDLVGDSGLICTSLDDLLELVNDAASGKIDRPQLEAAAFARYEEFHSPAAFSQSWLQLLNRVTAPPHG